MAKLTKEQVENLQKRIAEKGEKARSKWAKAVHDDACWLLENVMENMEDGEEVEINEELVLNGADDWKQFSWDGNALIYNGDIAEHYSTPSELKNFWGLTKDGGVKRDTNTVGEHLMDIQARALRQAWWLIRDELNGKTEFSMALGEYEEDDEENDIDFSIVDDAKGVVKATGELAKNIVKNTTEKGGILMF
jgi:hypothetical protein